MDPDPYWIRIGIQPKMLDPDPDEMNADPQLCMWGNFTLEDQIKHAEDNCYEVVFSKYIFQSALTH